MSTLLERFNAKWILQGECWKWTASKHALGYGRINVAGHVVPAHRLSFELFVGEIPKGLEIDHLCRNRWCVNPAHLDPVSHAENVRRGTSPSAMRNKTQTCLRGHSLSDAIRKQDGSVSMCRKCRNDRMRWRYHHEPSFRAAVIANEKIQAARRKSR